MTGDLEVVVTERSGLSITTFSSFFLLFSVLTDSCFKVEMPDICRYIRHFLVGILAFCPYF